MQRSLIHAAILVLNLSLATAAWARRRRAQAFDCVQVPGRAGFGCSLYVVDGANQIYRLSADDGGVQQTWPARRSAPNGLRRRAALSDDHNGSIYALDPQTGIVEDTFAAPDKQAAGLAYADGVLFVLERKTKTIYKVTPDDGTILATCPVPDRQCEALAWDGKYLWTANRVRNEIYMHEPKSGAVLNILDALARTSPRPGVYSGSFGRTTSRRASCTRSPPTMNLIIAFEPRGSGANSTERLCFGPGRYGT